MPGDHRQAILWSAAFDEANGQAIVTRQVAAFEEVDWTICTYRPGLSPGAVRSAIRAVIAVYAHAFRQGAGPIYAVVSRSGIGFCRDLPVLVLALLGRRVITHFHGSDILDLLERSPFRHLARVLYRRCAVVVPSAHLVSRVQAILGKSVTLCENSYVAPVRNTADAEPDVATIKTVVWNSNILASKGFLDTLAAVEQLQRSGHPLRFIVFGRPLSDVEKTADEIEALLDRYRDQPWFDRRGACPAVDVTRAVSTADVVVLPSRYASECQPLALIEAMCLARPIIASDTDAIRATLAGYPARLVRSGDIAGLVRAFSETWADSDQTKAPTDLRETAARRARTRFSPLRFKACLLEICFPEDAGPPVSSETGEDPAPRSFRRSFSKPSRQTVP